MPRVIILCGQDERENFEVPAGQSIHDVMLALNPATGNWPAPTICVYGGLPLMREAWPKTLLAEDDVVVFAELPMRGGGGGSNPLQAIMVVAVAVASVYTGGAAAAAYMGGSAAVAAAGGLTGGAMAVGALVSTAVSLAGGLISNMIFSSVPSGQMPAYQAEAASPTYSINGSANQARLYQPVPEGFGRFRIVPDIVADKWTQYIGNEMYLYQVFGCGRGLSEQHSMSFGDVEFWRDGNFVEGAYSSESGEQYTNVIGQTLLALADGGATYGPYRAVSATDSSRTLRLSLSFPHGLCSYSGSYVYDDHQGASVWVWGAIGATASFKIRSRPVDAQGNPLGAWEAWPVVNVNNATETAFTHLVSRTEAAYGQYEVDITNISTIPDYVSAETEEGTLSKGTRKQVVLDNVSSVGVSIAVQIVEPGGAVTLFPDNVDVSLAVASQELIAPNAEGHDWIGPFPTNAPGTRIDQILYGFVLPGGLGAYDSKGRLKNYTVSLEIQYQPIDDNGVALGDWATLRAPSYTAGTLTAQRRTESCPVPLGRYQSRVRRTSNRNADNKAAELLQWESMTGMIPGSLRYDQTVIAVKIKASNVLSQNAANNFTVLQTRKLPLYDRAAKKWSAPVPTRSFAAAMSQVCKASYGGALPDSQLDLDALWAIDEQLEGMGWHYDAWVDGAYTVWNLVIEMCNAVRVVPRPAGTVLSFVMDKSGRPVRHVFTPRNIVRGSFALTWNTFEDGTPDDVVLSYMDESVNYLQREVRAVLPESESRSPSAQTILGITNRDHAHQLGVFKAACNRWRRIGCEFETEGIGRVLQLGDVVSVSHPRFRNTASGVLAGWDAEALILYLESPLNAGAEAVDLYLSLTRPDGSPWGPVKLLWAQGEALRFDPADYAALLLQGFEPPFAWLTLGDDRMPTVWTLQEGREYSRRFIINGIYPQSVYRYRISCINDSDMVDSYDIPTPPWEYRSNLSDASPLSPPANLHVTLQNSDTATFLNATWEEVPGSSGYEVETSADGITWLRYGRVNSAGVTITVAYDAVWFRVATVRGYEQSSWAVLSAGTAQENEEATI